MYPSTRSSRPNDTDTGTPKTPKTSDQPDRVVLDAWPVVQHYIGAEPSASETARLLNSQTPIMSTVNFGEVYSALLLGKGVLVARDFTNYLRQSVELELPTHERIMQALHIKATWHVALGDGFAAATAISHGAVLWTGDQELIFDEAPWRVRDLRPFTPQGYAPTKPIGRRVRSRVRPADEPDVDVLDLMNFLEAPS